MNPVPPSSYYKQSTERLSFRAITADDIALWAAFFIDNPSQRFIGGDQLGRTPVDKAKKWIDKQIERKKEKTYGQLAVIEKASGNFIGLGGIIERPEYEGTDYEVTYSFLPSYWGKGYATELAVHFKNYVLKQIEAPTAISIIHVENEASMNVARKNEMTPDGEDSFLGMDVIIFRTARG